MYERMSVVTQALLFIRVKHSKLTQSEYIRCCHVCFNEFVLLLLAVLSSYMFPQA
jgi:hypothetical protein